MRAELRCRTGKGANVDRADSKPEKSDCINIPYMIAKHGMYDNNTIIEKEVQDFVRIYGVGYFQAFNTETSYPLLKENSRFANVPQDFR